MTALHPSNPYYNIARSREVSTAESTDVLLHSTNSTPTSTTRPDVPRSASIAKSAPAIPPSQTDAPSALRKASTGIVEPRVVTYRTRSIGGPFGAVYFEREVDTSPPNDDEIIIVTVRVSDPFRRASIEGNAELPARPRKRSFIKRVSTRVSGPTDGCRYTALKMPRKDYKKYFAKDRNGFYAGTEPERDWSDLELQQVFGRFQEMPLRSIPGGDEFGEGSSSNRLDGTDAVGGAQIAPAPEQLNASPVEVRGDTGSLDQMRSWGGFDGAGRRESLI